MKIALWIIENTDKIIAIKMSKREAKQFAKSFNHTCTKKADRVFVEKVKAKIERSHSRQERVRFR